MKKITQFIHTQNINRFCVLVIMLMLLFTCNAHGQLFALKYKIVQDNDVIGWMLLQKKDSANTFGITLSSETKKRFVFLFTIIENQYALFRDSVLTQSYVYRKINNNVKVNKQTNQSGIYYEIKKGNASTHISVSNIKYNQLCLYFFEPLNISQVYSDNYEQYLKIEKNEDKAYMLLFPDGNKNYYYYTNGICTKVKVIQSLFTVEFILSN